MQMTLINGKECRLVITGSVTLEFSHQLEAGIINAMRTCPHLMVDLSGVHEIDRCGVRLLELMQRLGGKEVHIVATSPSVESASQHLLVPRTPAIRMH